MSRPKPHTAQKGIGGNYLKESKVLAAQMSVPSMSRELSLLPFWKRWGEKEDIVCFLRILRTSGQKASPRPTPGGLRRSSLPPMLVT